MVSVALPVYNGARYLKRAVQSVLDQTYSNIELLIWDDDSTDDTEAIVRRFEDPRLRYHKNPARLGQFGNFNACLSAANGEYTFLFAYDDIMESEAVAIQLAQLQRYPEAGLSYCGVVHIDADGRVLSDSSHDATPSRIDHSLYLYLAVHYGALPAAISTVLLRMEAACRAGFFDASFKVAGDLEFWNRMADIYPIVHVADKLVRVRRHGEQVTNLSLTGYHYMQDEIGIARWFRERIAPAAWKKVYSYRMRTRAVNHFEWTLKRLLYGQFEIFWKAFRALSVEYPPLPLMGYYLVSLGNRVLKPKPMPYEDFRRLQEMRS